MIDPVAQPFTKKDRQAISQHRPWRHRPVNHWGIGDLPAPWCAGDIVEVPDDAPGLDRIPDGPGLYVISTAFSIDEGDAWYFRVGRFDADGEYVGSARLHVVCAERSTWDEDCDYLAGVRLVHTDDPAGLAKREQLIAAGWGLIGRRVETREILTFGVPS